MKKVILLGLLLISGQIFAATTVSIDMELKANGVYQQMSATSYKKLYTLVTGEAQVKIVDGFQTLANVKQPINKRENEKGKKELHVLGRDLVRIVDIEPDAEYPTNIDESVKARAKIKSDYVKSIKIKSEELEALYEEVFTQSGINQLRGLQINVDEVELETDFSLSDMTCKGKKGSALNCTQIIKLSIKATGR